MNIKRMPTLRHLPTPGQHISATDGRERTALVAVRAADQALPGARLQPRGCSGAGSGGAPAPVRRLFVYQRSATVRDEDSLLRRIVINLSITHYHRVLAAPHVFESVDKLDRCGMLIAPAAGPERTLAAEQELQHARLPQESV